MSFLGSVRMANISYMTNLGCVTFSIYYTCNNKNHGERHELQGQMKAWLYRRDFLLNLKIESKYLDLSSQGRGIGRGIGRG